MCGKNTNGELENIIYNIKWLRKHYGLSKKEMAELLNISIYSINKLEKGILPPRLKVDVIFAVWKHFGVSPTEQLKIGLC